MGRRKDNPALQAAKGFPGKRRKQVEAAIAEAEMAAAIMPPAAPSGLGDPPPLLLQKRFAPALDVWNLWAPRLVETKLFEAIDRPALMMLCVDYSFWHAATVRLARDGLTSRVKTVSGSYWNRKSPLVDIQTRFSERVWAGVQRFGLTPTDRYNLFKEFAAAMQSAPPSGDLFAHQPSSAPAIPDAIDAAAAIGSLDSDPPPTWQ